MLPATIVLAHIASQNSFLSKYFRFISKKVTPSYKTKLYSGMVQAKGFCTR